jgi:tetratricopeptide (TPR) repeat protein
MPASLIGVKRDVPHTIQPGETLSILSKRYYGDINHYDLIARYNGLEDPTSIRVGQQIKIPQVEGLPFLVEESQIEKSTVETPAAVGGAVPETPAPPMGTPAEKVEPAVNKENRPSLDEQVAGYRDQGIEFYNGKNYVDAINEFEKVLSARPGDQAAGKYMALSYYELGTQSYRNQDYPQAIQNSKKALEYDAGCANCQALIKKSEESFKDIHYRKGLDYFKDEKLADAIREWQLVYDMDPHYEDVDRNLQKARLLQERLDAIKRSKEGSQ